MSAATMNTPPPQQARLRNGPAVKAGAIILLGLSFALLSLPKFYALYLSLDRRFIIDDLYVTAHTLFVAAGIAGFHVTAYAALIPRKYKFALLTFVGSYGLLAVGVFIGRVVFDS